jgi:hypothetical protein
VARKRETRQKNIVGRAKGGERRAGSHLGITIIEREGISHPRPVQQISAKGKRGKVHPAELLPIMYW